MILSRKFSTIATLALALMAGAGVAAQNYRLPGQHAIQHGDLIASQGAGTMEVGNTTQYLEELFAEEEEPEMDIYTEGWNSGFVNCYNAADVPQTAVIDVRRFHIPHPGYITSPYGYRPRFKRVHKGIDIKANTGDTIRAAFDGKVRLTKYEAKGYGYYIVLRHPNDLETVYGHLSKFLVEPDQYVRAGDPIGLAGNTGRSFGSHLHFETRYMGYAINPAAIVDFPNQTTHTDYYTFDKNTYTQARNFSPEANEAYAREYRATHHIEYGSSRSSSSSSRSGSSTYTVRKGDSLSRIASRNGTTVRNLCRLNGITTSTTLRPGQKLRIR